MLFLHGHSVVEDGRLSAETAASRLFMDLVSDWQLQFSRTQITEKRWNISSVFLLQTGVAVWNCLQHVCGPVWIFSFNISTGGLSLS